MKRSPTYLRVVLTEACTMNCTFCHAEGLKLPSDLLETESALSLLSPLNRGQAGMSSSRKVQELERWKAQLQVALDHGIRKLKFLGGEPLLSPVLNDLIRWVKQRAPETDLSLITAGGVPPEKLQAAFDAGLDRANLSIHGWTEEAFARNAKAERRQRLFTWRNENLQLLLKQGRFLKLNYVYTDPEVEADLLQLLSWAANKNVVVSVLDDLNQPDMSPDTIRSMLARLLGPPSRSAQEHDPHSLDTERLSWATGLVVEIKSSQLGKVAPWSACSTCPRRPICREGIFALRLEPDGQLRPCADRPDLGYSLRESVQQDSELAGLLWTQYLDNLLEGGMAV